jgi:hypothetical protein
VDQSGDQHPANPAKRDAQITVLKGETLGQEAWARCTGHLGVKGSQVQILSSRQKALVRGNFHQGFVGSGCGHWLVHLLDLLEPSAD